MCFFVHWRKRYIFNIKSDNLTDFIRTGRDGGYSEWTDYSTCSATCGVGTTSRSRQCDNPTPLANGDKCDVLGPAVETKECTRKPCVGKCGSKKLFLKIIRSFNQ